MPGRHGFGEYTVVHSEVRETQVAGREELGTFWGKWEYLSSRIDRLKEGGE